MASRRFVMLVKEASYGTPVDTPVVGTDAFYLRMTNPVDLYGKPILQTIPYGGGRTTPACAYTDQMQCTGSISTLLYPAQAKVLLDWALTPVNTGRTTPWVTTDAGGVMPPGDLASMSLYDAIQEADGTYTRTRYSGVKVVSGSLSAQADGAARAWALTLQVAGMRDDQNAAGETAAPDDTEFPAPAETDYPCGPFLFSHIGGGLKIGSTRTLFDSVNLSWTSTVESKYFESIYPSFVRFYGRTTTLAVGLYRKKTPDDYAAFKAVTAQDTEFTISNGVKSVKVDLNANNHWQDMTRNLPDGSTYGWAATLQNKWDATAATDLVISGT